MLDVTHSHVDLETELQGQIQGGDWGDRPPKIYGSNFFSL